MIIKLVIAYYSIINVLLFSLMGIDKHKAIKKLWRIPEATLLTLSVFGGFIGGFLGMRIFHHKTKKKYFYAVFSVSMLFHFFLLYWFFALK